MHFTRQMASFLSDCWSSAWRKNMQVSTGETVWKTLLNKNKSEPQMRWVKGIDHCQARVAHIGCSVVLVETNICQRAFQRAKTSYDQQSLFRHYVKWKMWEDKRSTWHQSAWSTMGSNILSKCMESRGGAYHTFPLYLLSAPPNHYIWKVLIARIKK